MANNPYVNKVEYYGETLIDISDATVTADKLLQGYTAYDASGAKITGTAVAGSGSAVVVTDTPDSHGGTIREITAVSLAGDTVSPAVLQQGYTAHNAQGEAITGTLVPGGSVTLQEKTVSPSTSQQVVTADAGYDALSKVTVNAMPTATQATPNVSINSRTGLVTATATQTAGYVAAGTKSGTLQLTTKAAATITPGTTNQTIAAGQYLTGAQTIAGDADLVSGNILSGVDIFGVVGSVEFVTYYTGSGAPSASTGSDGDIYLQTGA